jgi:hypothetical protein
VVLRTQGGRDIAWLVADTLLKKRAGPLRQMQKDWQSRLGDLVARLGQSEVRRLLRSHGAEGPSENILYGWVHGDRIRPHARADFEAILQATGLGREAERYHSSMAEIASAHSRAGHRIREMLLKQLTGVRLDELARTGRTDLVLSGGVGGSIGIFRVESVAAGTHRVPANRLHVPFLHHG